MADALASGASVRKDVGVQVPPRAPWVSAGGKRPVDAHLLLYVTEIGNTDT